MFIAAGAPLFGFLLMQKVEQSGKALPVFFFFA